VDAESLEKDYIVQKPAQHYALPDKDKRDIFFEGISSKKNLDELEKDMLYMAIKTKSLKDLKNMLRKE
jgi:hypothetical protein